MSIFLKNSFGFPIAQSQCLQKVTILFIPIKYYPFYSFYFHMVLVRTLVQFGTEVVILHTSIYSPLYLLNFHHRGKSFSSWIYGMFDIVNFFLVEILYQIEDIAFNSYFNKNFYFLIFIYFLIFSIFFH